MPVADARRRRNDAGALAAAGITGEDGGKIDHVEFFGPPADPAAQQPEFRAVPGRRL